MRRADQIDWPKWRAKRLADCTGISTISAADLPDWTIIDALDQRLVTLLRHDARRSISELAATSASAAPRCAPGSSGWRRGRDPRLHGDPARRRGGLPVRGVMLIEIEGHATDRVIRALGGFAEVSTIHTTNGRWDLIIELAAASLTDFDAVLRRIRLIPGITNSETNLLLATPRSTRARL
jgi:DNA-binding Lrp family transcriptional regulator